jgi:cbb3-type cytochrome oxidase subunit 3
MSSLLYGFTPSEWKLFSTVAFAIVFLGIFLWVYQGKRRLYWEAQGHIPLNDESVRREQE